MAELFDNYDNDKLHNPPAYEIEKAESNPLIIGSNNVKLLTDVDGKTLGVEVQEGSVFTIYFTLNCDDEDFTEVLEKANFTCNILNHRRQVILETDVAVYAENHVVAIQLASEYNGNIHKGLYYINLSMEFEGNIYSLLNSQSNLLYII